jgi:hypothetical protein
MANSTEPRPTPASKQPDCSREPARGFVGFTGFGNREQARGDKDPSLFSAKESFSVRFCRALRFTVE